MACFIYDVESTAPGDAILKSSVSTEAIEKCTNDRW